MMRLRLRHLSVECAQHQGDNWVKRGARNETVSGEWKQGPTYQCGTPKLSHNYFLGPSPRSSRLADLRKRSCADYVG